MKAIIWALFGGVLGAAASFGLFMAYCWAYQPRGTGGGLGSSTWAVGVGQFYFAVALPLAIVLGALVGAAVGIFRGTPSRRD